MAFATVEDIEERYRDLSPDEEDRAAVLLDDAEVLIRALFRNAHKELDVEAMAQPLKVVSCSIVMRALNNPITDYTQHSITAGSFSEQYTYSSDGQIWIKRGEKAMLGLLGTGRLQNVSLLGGC